jgi:phosphoesterase RecJ-like protein
MDWNKATELVKAAQRIIVLTHLAPDGDAIGTLLGLGQALRESGKTVTLAVDEGVPGTFAFLPEINTVRANLKDVEADLVIAVDCADESRMGEAGKQARRLNKPLINVDHHASNTNFGDLNFVDAQWAAASEGVMDWLDAMDTAISPTVAQCLLCGIVTDTLCFRTASTTSQTLDRVQRLMERGGNLTFIVQHTLSRVSTNTIRLWAQVMPTVRIEDHVIWATVDLAAQRIVGGGNVDIKDGGLVNLLLQADEAYISCIFHEKEGNKVELSLRAVPGFDVSGVATSIGGGGHKLASGATVAGSLSEVEARVIPLLKEAARIGTPIYA